MNKAWTFARLVKQLLVVIFLVLACAPALVAAQTMQTAQTLSPGLGNPLNRNPLNRRGLSDSAPVEQDLRNSTTRPTLPSAPVAPDVRDVVVPAPDRSRDVTQPAAEPVTPSSPPGLGRRNS